MTTRNRTCNAHSTFCLNFRNCPADDFFFNFPFFMPAEFSRTLGIGGSGGCCTCVKHADRNCRSPLSVKSSADLLHLLRAGGRDLKEVQSFLVLSSFRASFCFHVATPHHVSTHATQNPSLGMPTTLCHNAQEAGFPDAPDETAQLERKLLQIVAGS